MKILCAALTLVACLTICTFLIIYFETRLAMADDGYAFAKVWGYPGTGPGQFNRPQGIAIDSSRNVYVVDYANHRIQKFDNKGTFIREWGSQGSAIGQFQNPFGIALDPLGYVYVTDSGNNRIQKFTSDGNFVKEWGTFGTGDGEFNKPFAIAVDKNGDVYASDNYNHRIQKFTSDGQFLTKWGSLCKMGSGEGCVDPDGATGIRQKGDGQLDWPTGITIDTLGNIYVSDVYNYRIQKFTSDGNFTRGWGSMDGKGSDADGMFNSPAGISSDSNNNIFVADSGNNRIQKFTSDGQFLTKWGSFGTGNGQFQNPVAIAVDYLDNIYATDDGNSRVQEFSLPNNPPKIEVIPPPLRELPHPSLPSKPESLRAKMGLPMQITLSWARPQQDGGSPITGYKIERKVANADEWSLLVNNTGNTKTSYRDSDVQINTMYSYRAFAVNSVGTSPASNEITTFTNSSPNTIPSIPLNPSATPESSTEINLIWTVPLSDGGSPITDYKIEYKEGNATYNTSIDVSPSKLSYLHTGLRPNTTYSYRVYAINSIGESLPSNEASAVTPPAQPNNSLHINVHDITVNSATDAGMAVNYASEVSVTDAKDGNTVNLVCFPSSGSFFKVGTTPITCTASDSAGVQSKATFNIIVNGPAPPAVSLWVYLVIVVVVVGGGLSGWWWLMRRQPTKSTRPSSKDPPKSDQSSFDCKKFDECYDLFQKGEYSAREFWEERDRGNLYRILLDLQKNADEYKFTDRTKNEVDNLLNSIPVLRSQLENDIFNKEQRMQYEAELRGLFVSAVQIVRRRLCNGTKSMR